MNANPGTTAASASHAAAPARAKCQLCEGFLDGTKGDDCGLRLCAFCKKHPDARKVIQQPPAKLVFAAAGKSPAASVSELSSAERALIRRVHGFMAAEQLLKIINERREFDTGSGVSPCTMEQLYAEIGDADAVSVGRHDWASLRKLLAKARKDGLLEAIDEQMIKDFSVIWSLNDRQLMVLKDTLLPGEED